MPKNAVAVNVGAVQQRIFQIRGRKVIIDADLAEFYGVATKRLNEQVKRNAERFPPDFMFQLNVNEKRELLEKCEHLSRLKYSKALPHAFTEHGAIMAATVLSTPRAVRMSVFVVRAFVQLRELAGDHVELSRRLGVLERRLSRHDDSIRAIVAAIRKLAGPEKPPSIRRIGFRPDESQETRK